MYYYVTENTDSPVFIGSNLLTYAPGEVHNRRIFPVFNLIVVHSGRLVLVEDNVEYVVNSGEYFIQEPYKLHYGTKPDVKPVTFSFVHFILPEGWKSVRDKQIDNMYVQMQSGEFLRPDKYRLFIPKYGNCSKASLQTAYELSLGLRQCYSALKSKALFYKLFDEIIEGAQFLDNENISLRDIKNFIDRYYIEPNFSFDWVCEKFRYSRQYLTKILKEQTGMNFRDYVGHLKIEHAKKLLMPRNTTIYNIAATLGYADTTAFCHHFHKKTGLTPSEYQKKHPFTT